MSQIICLNTRRKTKNYRKFKTLVSAEDYDFLSSFSWTIDTTGYAHRKDKNRKKIFMHSLVMHTPKGMETDHINGNKLDNQRGNLRICTHSENMKNRKKEYNGLSNYKGVTRHKQMNQWLAQIKSKYIGTFDLEIHAAMAYDMWSKEIYGKFAQLNFKTCHSS
jgi:hypothetical protein